MKHQINRHLLVSLAIVMAAVSLALVSSVATSSDIKISRAPLDGCGAVSCTTYLPIIFRDYPPPSLLEVTQAVQQPDNSVPLIANRTTFVRLTLTSTIAHTDVSAWLYGTRDGAPLPGSPIVALNNPRTLKTTVDRSVLSDTFNFQLPSSWLSGSIALSGYATDSSTFTFSGGAKTFQFIQANPMHVTIVPIAYTCSSGGSGTSTPAGPYAYLTDYAFRTYPVPSILTSTHASLSYSGPCTNYLYGNEPAPTYNDMMNILDLVTSAWRSDGSPHSYYYGLLHEGPFGGWAKFPDPVAAGGESSELHAHEVGHNHGRPTRSWLQCCLPRSVFSVRRERLWRPLGLHRRQRPSKLWL